MKQTAILAVALIATLVLGACSAAPATRIAAPTAAPQPTAAAATQPAPAPTAAAQPAPTATARPAPTATAVPTQPPAPPSAELAPSTLPKAAPAAGKGNVEGRILWNGKPAANIELQLCEDVDSFNGCTGKSYKTVTNAGGDYRFADVLPGDYALTLRVFDTKDWLYITSGLLSARKYTVATDKTLDIRPQHIFKTDLVLKSPAEGAQVTLAGLSLSWQPYESAAYYQVTLTPDSGDEIFVDQKVNDAQLAVPGGLMNCLYTWRVAAYNAAKFKIAESDSGSFAITGEDAGCEMELVQPPMGTTVVPATGLVLEWRAHPKAKYYEVVLYDPDRLDGKKALDFVKVTTTKYTVDQKLEPGQYLYWVQAHDATDRMIADSAPMNLTVK